MRGWTRRRVLGAAVVSACAPFALLAVLHFTVGRRPPPTPELPVAAAAPEPPLPPPASSASAPPASASAAEPNLADNPTEIDGLDSEEWRKLLRNTAETSDWKRAGAAILALWKLDPAALTRPEIIDSTAKVVSQLPAHDPDLGEEVFNTLASGPYGLDVFYRLMSVRAGSKVAARARDLLKEPEVRERASPALRIALELREAPCSKKEALAPRAAEVGDHRALMLLVPLRSAERDPYRQGCCLSESAAVANAVRAITARTYEKR